MTPPHAGFLDWLFSVPRPLLTTPVLAGLLVLVWWFFRDTWRELDDDATRWRIELADDRRADYRPFVALALCALVLTLQEYYGGRGTYDDSIRPILFKIEAHHPTWVHIGRYDNLYGFCWWSFTRVAGYVAPLTVWRFFFPEDSILDMGFRFRGFFSHAWIYGFFLAILLPVLLIVVLYEPDFGSYYPFYKECSRSWLDLLVWEGIYFAQFFGLEVFFRGFWLASLRRSFGSGAIFAMAVPYCMIHFGKPFLEANGAIVAGIALGSLSMKTKSIYQGFLVHITVAGLMDWLALWHRHGLPHTFWPK